MQIEKLRSLIREAVDNQLKEIEAVAEAAAMEARLAEYDKAIKTCEAKIQAAENLEEVKDLMDEGKVNELKKKLKSLTKAKEKLEKQKAKKNKGKEVTTDAETDKMDEAAIEEGPGPWSQNNNDTDDMENMNVEETYTMDEMETEGHMNEEMVGGVNYDSVIAAELKAEVGDLSKLTPYVLEKGDNVQSDSSGKIHVTDSETNKKTVYKDIADFLRGVGYQIKMNESFLKMQKLAGVITEAQYNQKKSLVENQINEEKDINEFGKSLMDKLKKSGFDAKFVDNEVKKIELEKIVKENPKKLAVVYFDKAINYVSIITNKDNQDEALKIAESSKSLLPDGYTVSKQGGYFVQIQPSLR